MESPVMDGVALKDALSMAMTLCANCSNAGFAAMTAVPAVRVAT